jgi:hypothetical protein
MQGFFVASTDGEPGAAQSELLSESEAKASRAAGDGDHGVAKVSRRLEAATQCAGAEVSTHAGYGGSPCHGHCGAHDGFLHIGMHEGNSF